MSARAFRLTICSLTLLVGFILSSPAGAQQKEYKSTAKQTRLLRADLAAFDGKEANVILVEVPPGWVGGRHYHTGDVFVYVQEGSFAIDVDGEGRKTFHAGEVYHEALKKNMLARNPSSSKPAKIVLFQIGEKGEPLMYKAE